MAVAEVVVVDMVLGGWANGSAGETGNFGSIPESQSSSESEATPPWPRPLLLAYHRC